MSETGDRDGQTVIREPGGGTAIPLGEAGTVYLKVVGDETAGRLTIYEFAMPPATAGPPLHLHRTWDEAFYVLDGEMTFQIAGEERLAPAGSFVFIPRGVLHTFWNASAAPTRQLTIFTPAGIEGYFEAVSPVMAIGGDDSLVEAAALMATHDMVVPESARPAYQPLHAREASR